MKKVLMPAVVAAVVAAVVFLAGCASTPKAIPNEEAWGRFVGEWTSPEKTVTGDMYPVLQVYEADLVGKWYYFSSDGKPNLELRFTPRKSWVDAKGNVYCQVHFQRTEFDTRYSTAFECAGLMRIDATGKVLEINAIQGISAKGSMADWAYAQLEEIDPDLAKKLPANWGLTSVANWTAIYWIYNRT